MTPAQIAGHTHVLGAPADWDEARDGPCGALHVRQEGRNWLSAWKPNEAEIAAMAAGGVIALSVVGGQPPVWVAVADRKGRLVPDDATPPAAVDWRKLLVRYMAAVCDTEGVSFVDLHSGHTVKLTDQEKAVLDQIETEAREVRDARS